MKEKRSLMEAPDIVPDVVQVTFPVSNGTLPEIVRPLFDAFRGQVNGIILQKVQDIISKNAQLQALSDRAVLWFSLKGPDNKVYLVYVWGHQKEQLQIGSFSDGFYREPEWACSFNRIAGKEDITQDNTQDDNTQDFGALGLELGKYSPPSTEHLLAKLREHPELTCKVELHIGATQFALPRFTLKSTFAEESALASAFSGQAARQEAGESAGSPASPELTLLSLQAQIEELRHLFAKNVLKTQS